MFSMKKLIQFFLIFYLSISDCHMPNCQNLPMPGRGIGLNRLFQLPNTSLRIQQMNNGIFRPMSTSQFILNNYQQLQANNDMNNVLEN